MAEAAPPPLGLAGDDDAGNIKVCVRVRPFAAREQGETCCVAMPTETEVQISGGLEGVKSYNFDRAYWSHRSTDANFATQQTLVDDLGQRIIKNTLDGFNSTLFAYGQTGSGKTFSVLGSDDCPENRGLLPRIIEDLFKQIEVLQGQNQNVQFQCRASYLEVYNEKIRDLLIPTKQNSEVKLEIRRHPTLGIYVPGLLENAVTNYEMVQKMITFGAKTRSVAATSMNATSSRSHCIFIFFLDKQEQVDGKKTQLRARVNLVDLAGSERQKKTGAEGDRLKEGAKINQSLSNLAVVINKLAEVSTSKNTTGSLKQGSHDFVPFRSSKLTYLLQESLSGNSKTVLIAALSPALSNYDETVSTLRFAETCKSITTQAKKNEESSESLIASLKAEIARLKSEVGSDPEVAKKLEDSEAFRAKLEQDFQEQVLDAKRREQDREQALADMGLNISEISGEFGMDPNVPQLINISDDPALSGCLVYFLPPGVDTTLGTNKACKIVLMGLGVKPYMCCLRNEENSKLTLTLLSASGSPLPAGGSDAAAAAVPTAPGKRAITLAGEDAPGRVMVNGRAAKNGREMQHTDRLILGHAYCFRVIVPVLAAANAPEAAGAAAGAGEVSIAEALCEVMHDHAEEFEQCRALMDSMQDQIGSKQTQEFLHLFGRVLPMVEEGNLITSEVRPQDGLRFQLEVCNDIFTYKTDQPELIVRLYRRQPDGSEAVTAVFEIQQYEERLAHIREFYRDFLSHPDAVNFAQLGSDPWAAYSFDEVQDMLRVAAHDRDEQADKREQLEARLLVGASSANDRREQAGDSASARQLAEHDGAAADLRKQLAERDARIAELERSNAAAAAAARRGPELGAGAGGANGTDATVELRRQLAEHDDLAANLRKHLAERDARIVELERSSGNATHQVQEPTAGGGADVTDATALLRKQLTERDARIPELERSNAIADQHVLELEAELERLRNLAQLQKNPLASVMCCR